ncbi:MAG: hypothetical protein ACXV5T_08325, partial [Halobacteriota archaeon]
MSQAYRYLLTKALRRHARVGDISVDRAPGTTRERHYSVLLVWCRARMAARALRAKQNGTIHSVSDVAP